MSAESNVTPQKTAAFQKTILSFYRKHKRQLPWRDDTSPYSVFVSEIMLQQTQVERVRQKYPPFIERFPDFQSLADSSLEEVFIMWKGLGYNRRARALRDAARIIIEQHGGVLPSSPQQLEQLPGIGSATAASIAAFAFNAKVLFLETNIRTVYIHHFFPDSTEVRDSDIIALLEQTIDWENTAEWYSALMDYGTELKKIHGNLSRKSSYYKKQSRFVGSRRQLRGLVLALLLEEKVLSVNEIVRKLKRGKEPVSEVLELLTREGIVQKERSRYRVGE